MKIALCIVVALAAPRIARAQNCATPPNIHSQVYDEGINLASGYVTALPLASLGPIEVFHNECATGNAGITLGTKGVFSSVDSTLELFANGDMGIVSIRGIATYRYQGGLVRKVPDDGSYLVANGDGSFSLKSQITPDELVYRNFAGKYFLSEVRRTVGAVWQPYAYTYFYDRGANGALTQIRSTNSPSRIAVESELDGAVRVAEYLPGQAVPARWFRIRRVGERLASVEQAGPNGVASVQYTLSTAGRILHIRYPSGGETQIVYDTEGRVRDRYVYEPDTGRVIDHTRYGFTPVPEGFAASIAKDHDGFNETARHTFDPRGLLIRTSIGGIDVRRATYDQLERLTIDEMPAENTLVRFGYWGQTEAIYYAVRNDRLVYWAQQSDSSGMLPFSVLVENLQKTISYDSFMRPTQVVAHDGSTQTFSYTPVGVASVVDACTTSEPSGDVQCVRTDYGRGGLVTRVANGSVGYPDRNVTEVERNANNFMTRVIDRVGTTVAMIRTYSGHDFRGTPTNVTTADYILGGAARTEAFTFYPDGSLMQLASTEGWTQRYAYDAAGQLKQYTLDVRGRARAADGVVRATTVDVTPSSSCGSSRAANVNGAPTTASSSGTPQQLPPEVTEDGDEEEGWTPGGETKCTELGGIFNAAACHQLEEQK